jgi:predicted ribonuclease YlaK
MAKKTYVIDTSVLLTDFNSVNKFSNNDIVIPLSALMLEALYVSWIL